MIMRCPRNHPTCHCKPHRTTMFKTKAKPTIILAATTLVLTSAVAFGLKTNAQSTYQAEQDSPQYDAPYKVHAQNLTPVTASVTQPAQNDDSILLKLRSEEHTSELQSRGQLVCRLLLEKKDI